MKRISKLLAILLIVFCLGSLCACIPESEAETEFETEVIAPANYIEKWSISASGDVMAYIEDAGNNYILTIVGNGQMKDFENNFDADVKSYYAPWYTKYANSLQSIAIGTGVTSIGNYAFYGCVNLVSFKMGKSIKTIGSNSFKNCHSLSSLKIVANTTTIGDNAFDGCYNLTKFEVDTANNDFSANDGVLHNKDKTTLIKCPAGKKVDNYEVLATVTEIKNYAFSECRKVKKISFAEESTLQSISSYSFAYCTGLNLIILPNSLTTIPSKAFYECNCLEGIVLPNSITKIEADAFYNCWSFVNIYYTSNETDFKLIDISDASVLGVKERNGVYYYSDTQLKGTWHYNEDGVPFIVTL